MYFTTIIKKTVTGIMQATGGFAEPITRTLGIRTRTTAGNAVQITHDDTDGQIESTAGKLKIVATGGVEINGNAVLAVQVGDTAARPAAAAARIYIDTELGVPIFSDGITWKNAAGVEI